MDSKEDALEAAKLAKAISSQLGLIDKLSVDRPERPANQIDINSFISRVVNPSRQMNNSSSGYVPEELVQSLVPEPKYTFEQPFQNTNPVQQNNNQIQENQIPLIIPNTKKQNIVKNQISEPTNLNIDDKTIKKIVNSLERIAKSYEKYVDCYVECNTIKKENNILNG
jgi:hypothetical protein